MKANTVGGLLSENYLKRDVPVIGTDPIVIISPPLDDMDGICFQIVTGDFSQTFTATGTDNVDEDTGTATWTFANGDFHADMVGGDMTVSGAAQAGNNGTFTITAVNSATEVETTTSTEVDETFTSAVSVTVVVDGDPIQATFTVEVSGNFVPEYPQFPGLGQDPNPGNWGDVTSKFANTGSPFFPAIAAITADGAPYYQMYPLVGRFARWTVTPTNGIGGLSFIFGSKGNR